VRVRSSSSRGLLWQHCAVRRRRHGELDAEALLERRYDGGRHGTLQLEQIVNPPIQATAPDLVAGRAIGRELTANRAVVGPWETFVLTDVG
jgi:hypothetical protein